MITGRRAYPKLLVRGLVVFAAGMTIFAAVASREHNSSQSARNEVLSQYVALQSRSLESSDPALASQLALVAYRISRTPDARSALLDATASEMPTRLLGPSGKTGLAVGDDGHRLAISYQSTGQVKIYSLRYAQLTPLATIAAVARTARIDSVAISHRGDLLAIGDSVGRVALWSLTSPRHPTHLTTLSAGTGAVHGLSFSPGGAALAAADANGAVARWSLTNPANPTAAAMLVVPGRPALLAVSYSHTGDTLTAVGRSGSLVIWPAHGGTDPLATPAAGSATLTAVTYSPDGKWLAVGGKDGLTRVWRLDGHGRPSGGAASLPGSGAITTLAFSRDSRFLALGTASRTARISSTTGWTTVARLSHPVAVTGVAFSNGDRRVISSDAAGSALLWQFPSPSSYSTGSAVTDLSFSLTKPVLAVHTASGPTQLWDVVNEWHPSPVGSWNAVPFTAAPTTEYWLVQQQATSTSATTTATTTTTAVNPAAGDKALGRTRALTTVATSVLSPTGQLFAAAGDNKRIYLWNVSDPSAPTLVNTLTGPTTPITRLAFSPDGRRLAISTSTGHVWLFGVGTPKRATLQAKLIAGRGKLTALAFSPSDDTLVAGGVNGRLTFWHYRPYQAVDRICALAGTPITPQEWATYVPQASYDPPCANWTPPPPVQLKTSG
jgi:WD40 repeat protein